MNTSVANEDSGISSVGSSACGSTPSSAPPFVAGEIKSHDLPLEHETLCSTPPNGGYQKPHHLFRMYQSYRNLVRRY